MIAKILGYFFIAIGVFFLIKPLSLRNKLHKKFYKKIRYFLLAASFIIGSYLIGFGFKHSGLLPKILMVIGIIAIVKALFFLKAKAYEKIIEWLSKAPIYTFRIIAIIYILLGILLIVGAKK